MASKIQKHKVVVIALATALTIAFAILTSLPIATAQKTKTTAYLSFRPNPIGVNQELLINAWVTPPPLLNWSDFSTIPRNGYMIYITDPDGNIDVLGPFDAYSDGTIWLTYTPNKVGNWTIQFSWAGDENFEPCQTEKQILIVQQNPIPSWPAAPLPTEQWTWPINPENREWCEISGLWSQSGYNASRTNYNPYSLAPSSPHILWKLPPAKGLGGLIGGAYGSTGFYEAVAASIDVVIVGRGYYQAGGMIHCVDIRTGEELWATLGSYTVGAVDAVPVYWEGVISGYSNAPILLKVGSRLIKYDALTGEILLNETGIESDFNYVDYPYVYTFDITNNQLIKWTCLGIAADFSERVMWNVTVPWPAHEEFVIYDDIIASVIGGFYPLMSAGAINATTGELLWTSPNCPYTYERPNPAAAYGKLFYPTMDRHYAAANLSNGETEWLSEEADYPWGNFWGYGTAAAYGMVYGVGYDGVYAFNQSNGAIIWHFKTGNSGFETPYGTWAFFNTPLVADGKIYAANSEHSIHGAIPRGQRMYCLNASTGEPIWSIMGYYTPTAIAEGILFATNAYDGCSYAFGKGETTITVSASPEVTTKGSSILIKGTVLDMSPAQQGSPAIADEFMSAWMEYLHMQQPRPTNARGVEVILSVIDSNNNCYEIGRTTSDITGQYSFIWEPEIPGRFQIIATFRGSEAYYGSTAVTYIGVSEAPVLTPQPSYPQPIDPTWIIIGVGIAIIIANAIVGFLLLKKR